MRRQYDLEIGTYPFIPTFSGGIISLYIFYKVSMELIIDGGEAFIAHAGKKINAYIALTIAPFGATFMLLMILILLYSKIFNIWHIYIKSEILYVEKRKYKIKDIKNISLSSNGYKLKLEMKDGVIAWRRLYPMNRKPEEMISMIKVYSKERLNHIIED